MNGSMLACLLIVAGLVVADQIRMRFVAKRERAHRAYLREKERRLREKWDGQMPAPGPVAPEHPRP